MQLQGIRTKMVEIAETETQGNAIGDACGYIRRHDDRLFLCFKICANPIDKGRFGIANDEDN